MSKLELALDLADETGVALAKAMKYIDDVGPEAARGALDDAAELGGKTVSDWWKPAAAAGGVLGGGALLWRHQDVERAKEIADKSQSTSNALHDIMASDLSPEAKQALTNQLLNTNGGGNDQQDDGSNWLPDDPMLLIIGLIVLIFVLKFGLDGDD